jgi:hypothetical protein
MNETPGSTTTRLRDAVLLVVIGPVTHQDVLLTALADAGAGAFGAYTACSFTQPGVGRFRPEAGANPAIGTVGALETVREVRIETICLRSRVRAVLAAVRAAHPYEEPALYLLPLLHEDDF